MIRLLIDGGGTFLVIRPETVGATLAESDQLVEGALPVERKRVLYQAVMGAAEQLIQIEPVGRC